MNSAPIVGLDAFDIFLKFNDSKIDVFPTPESPITTTFKNPFLYYDIIIDL